MGVELGYIRILIESLHKKLQILDGISAVNAEQRSLAAEDKLDLEKLSPTLDKKQTYLDQLDELDVGFETIYQRVKEELENCSADYKKEIQELQLLISQVTEKGMAVQAEEERNRQAIQNQFGAYKKELRQSKLGRKAAANYYNKMNHLENVSPQFLDKKK
jgi:flagellar biosynthesis/type III secretory pathway chaperone